MKGNTQTITDTRPTLPLSALILSPDNARRSRNPNKIESMAASIAAVGIIQNVVVVPGVKRGTYEVVAGGNRLLAQQLRLERGEIKGDEPIPYLLRERDQAMVLSTTENVQREAMHPADEYDAIAKMYADGKGMTIDRIADALGVTPLVVERRLALASASPNLLDLFRQDEISTDQLMALCATDDHERQESVWANAPRWNRDPRDLRRMVLDSEIDAGRDPRVAFIGGIEVYRAAGGNVRRDLMTDAQQNAGFIDDEALLARLVDEKLEAAAESVRGEGWGWVEVLPKFDHNAFNRLGRLERMTDALPTEAQAAVDALGAETEKLVAERQKLENQSDDLTEQQEERYNDIEERLQAISDEIEGLENEHASYPAEAMPLAGAWVTLNNGELTIERGLVKPEDRKQVAKATKDSGAVAGGRETTPAGRKNGDTLSDALRRSLLGRRNHAAQMAVANNVRVAKILMAVQAVDLVGRGRVTYGGDSVPCDLTFKDYSGGTRVQHPIQGEDAGSLGHELRDFLESLMGKAPKSEAALWDLMASKPDAELDAIIACGIAASVSLDDGHKSVTGKLLDALGFDMAAHMQATADNYFGRVSKPLILAALKETGQDTGREALEKLKKGELASEAEKRLQGIAWVPKLIRSPAPKADKPKAAAPAKSQATTKKATKKAATKTTRKAPAKKAGKAKRK